MFCDVSMIKIFMDYAVVESHAGENCEGVLIALPSKSKLILTVPTS